MPKRKLVIFQVENVLLLSRDLAEYYRKKLNTEPMQILHRVPNSQIMRSYYMFNKDDMDQTFKLMLENGIYFGFYTDTQLKSEYYIPLLSKLLHIPEVNLEKCIFINGHHYGEHAAPQDNVEEYLNANLIFKIGKSIFVQDLCPENQIPGINIWQSLTLRLNTPDPEPIVVPRTRYTTIAPPSTELQEQSPLLFQSRRKNTPYALRPLDKSRKQDFVQSKPPVLPTIQPQGKGKKRLLAEFT